MTTTDGKTKKQIKEEKTNKNNNIDQN